MLRVVLPRQNQVVSGPTWGGPFCLPEGLGVCLHQCQTRASVQGRSCPSSPLNVLAALGFGPSSTSLWVCVFQGSTAQLMEVLLLD